MSLTKLKALLEADSALKLPKKFWAIRKGGRVVASGNHVGMDPERLSEIAKNYGEGAEVVFSDESLSKRPDVGQLFGYTWEQIRRKQQKLV